MRTASAAAASSAEGAGRQTRGAVAHALEVRATGGRWGNPGRWSFIGLDSTPYLKGRQLACLLDIDPFGLVAGFPRKRMNKTYTVLRHCLAEPDMPGFDSCQTLDLISRRFGHPQALQWAGWQPTSRFHFFKANSQGKRFGQTCLVKTLDWPCGTARCAQRPWEASSYIRRILCINNINVY